VFFVDFNFEIASKNLPELLVYHAGTLVQRTFLEDIGQINKYLHASEQRFPADSTPQIASLLTLQDWCRGES